MYSFAVPYILNVGSGRETAGLFKILCQTRLCDARDHRDKIFGQLEKKVKKKRRPPQRFTPISVYGSCNGINFLYYKQFGDRIGIIQASLLGSQIGVVPVRATLSGSI